jgi:hypothetical protein
MNDAHSTAGSQATAICLIFIDTIVGCGWSMVDE